MSMFTMENVHTVKTMDNLLSAKIYCIGVVRNSSAKLVTQDTAVRKINNVKSIKDLMFLLSGYIMSHPVNGLKVIKL